MTGWVLTCLGSGGAFVTQPDNWQSNFLLTSPAGRHLLIDCGGDARWALKAHGMSAGDVDGVYVSHLHNDHIGGLEWLAFSTRYGPRPFRPRLFVAQDLVDPLWQNALSAGLGPSSGGVTRLDHWFDVHPVPMAGAFLWEGLGIQMVPVRHIDCPDQGFVCHGLSFCLNGQEVLFTSDAMFQPDHLMRHYRRADLILHDCETSAQASGVHARYAQLLTLPADLRAKMWLYHYQSGTLPDAQEDGFLGFMMAGQILS